MHTFPSNVYSSTIEQVQYNTTHAQCMLHPRISCEGASNDVKVLRTLLALISDRKLGGARERGYRRYDKNNVQNLLRNNGGDASLNDHG